MTRDDIIKKLVKLKPYISKKYHLSELGLFGSYVRGDNDGNSDIDILIDYTQGLSLFSLVDLQDDLEKSLGQKVDIAIKRCLKKYIKDNILKEVVYI